MAGNRKEQVISFCKALERTVISTTNISENMDFVKQSKERAAKHEWLYHCTTDIAVKSILQSREFWLSNLKIVNDAEECERIDVPEYGTTYYVCCFTYDPNIPPEHWEEYGTILLGVKHDWFLRRAIFMTADNQKCQERFCAIAAAYDDALKIKFEQQKNGTSYNPFYINSFGFYQIVYDDDLKKDISGCASLCINGIDLLGQSLTPEIAGIIKSTIGKCKRSGREPYEKNWTMEKEVRLKVGVQQMEIYKNGNEIHDGMIMSNCFFPKIAVPVGKHAFEEIRIGFSPKFQDRDAFISELETLMPNSRIEVI